MKKYVVFLSKEARVGVEANDEEEAIVKSMASPDFEDGEAFAEWEVTLVQEFDETDELVHETIY